MRKLAVSMVVAGLAFVAFGVAIAQERQRASPHEKTEGTVDGVAISVEYGRPYLKGRTIGKEFVPFGTVWRTGADEATTLVTAATLVFGTVEVPAGTYTLFTLPTATDWQLIVNKQTGQWGTQYDQAQDLARIPLQKTARATPLEQLTISIVDREGPGGALQIEWGTLSLSAPFTVKK